jgi:hypothetical protein
MLWTSISPVIGTGGRGVPRPASALAVRPGDHEHYPIFRLTAGPQAATPHFACSGADAAANRDDGPLATPVAAMSPGERSGRPTARVSARLGSNSNSRKKQIVLGGFRPPGR